MYVEVIVCNISVVFETQWTWNLKDCCWRLYLRLLWPSPWTFWHKNLISISPGPDTCDLILGHCLLWPWPVTYWHHLTSTSTNPKLGEIPFVGFWDRVLTKFSKHTDSWAYSQADRPENEIPPFTCLLYHPPTKQIRQNLQFPGSKQGAPNLHRGHTLQHRYCRQP